MGAKGLTMPSRRQERVAKRIVKEVVDAFREIKDGAKLGFVTVTGCEVSPDLRHAKVLLSVFGTEEDKVRNLTLVRRNASRLRGLVGRGLGLKMTPELHFEIDESIENADRMSRLISEARSTDANPNPLTPEEREEILAGMAKKGGHGGQDAGDGEDEAARELRDAFETARREVEEELFDDLDDDPNWKPVDLDKLPDDEDE